MNSWCFMEVQRQIEYKAAWDGIRVVYVRTANTSRTCSSCRSICKNLMCGRAWTCPTCGARHDRDLNAALNIMSRHPEAAAVRSRGEGRRVKRWCCAMRSADGGNLQVRSSEENLVSYD